jgi:hypothetical protein
MQPKSFEQIDSESLQFDSPDDAIHYAKQCVENSKHWLAVHNVNLCECYENLYLEVDLIVRSMSEMGDYHLIFRAVPLGWEAEGNNFTKISLVKGAVSGSDSDWNDDFMFVGITKLVQSPKKIIPSLVWLKRNHQVKDFFRNVLGWPFYSTLHFGEVVPEGELSLAGAMPSGQSNGISGLIETGAQAIYGVKGDPSQCVWHRLSELDLVKILRCIRISFSDCGVGFTIDKDSNLPFKITNMSLGMIETVL